MFLFQKGQTIDNRCTVVFLHKEGSYAETYLALLLPQQMVLYLFVNPVFNVKSFNMCEMLDIVGDHRKTFGLGRATDKEVKVFNLFASLPELGSFLSKGVYCFVAFVGTDIIEPFLNAPIASEQENADACVEQVSIHSSKSNVLLVLAERISFMISSAERLSFHAPTNRLAQPSFGLAVLCSSDKIELLSSDMRLNFSSLLISFIMSQYRDTEDVLLISPTILKSIKNAKRPALVRYIPCGREAVAGSIGCKVTNFNRNCQRIWQKSA